MITVDDRFALFTLFQELGDKAMQEATATHGKIGESPEEITKLIAAESSHTGKAMAFYQASGLVCSDEFGAMVEAAHKRYEEKQKAEANPN